MILLIENSYSDGHESRVEHHITEEPAMDDLDEWFEDVAYDLTGDGHGIGADLGSCYTATITQADNPALVGQTQEWID